MGCLIENGTIILNRNMVSVKEKERKFGGSLHRSLLSNFKESRLVLHTDIEMRDLRKIQFNIEKYIHIIFFLTLPFFFFLKKKKRCIGGERGKKGSSWPSLFHAHIPSNFHLLQFTSLYSRMFQSNQQHKSLKCTYHSISLLCYQFL